MISSNLLNIRHFQVRQAKGLLEDRRSSLVPLQGSEPTQYIVVLKVPCFST